MTLNCDQYKLKNGLTILAQHLPNVNSVAFNFKIPTGAAHIPNGCCGAGSVLADLLFRGTQSLDSKELITQLDDLGLHRSSGITPHHINLTAALESANLEKALELYSQIILAPKFDPQQFEFSKELAIQELIGLDDDPRQKVMAKLKEQFYPDPLGRPTMGKKDELSALSAEKTSEVYKNNLDLSNVILSIAGKYDFDKICSQMEQLFETDNSTLLGNIKLGSTGNPYTHEKYDGTQLHIGLMAKAVPMQHVDYYTAVVISSILGGGMSARLFTEVREKRGLCYAVGARYNTIKDHGSFAAYAGTVPEKAQQTLDVIIAEFKKLKEGVSEEELDRAKTGLKSSVIMSSESSSVRASAIGADHFQIGSVRSLDELKQKIDSVTTDDITCYLKDNPFEKFTVFTIGPNELKV